MNHTDRRAWLESQADRLQSEYAPADGIVGVVAFWADAPWYAKAVDKVAFWLLLFSEYLTPKG